ncbi:unnamed protein product [Phytophthora fragariaefolia]|uniref:Unnamed protein product n=1 Tax=Phytophthora fragariaefolia TaxID=1490495 RepID=A0A9W7D4C8_9STRA|nr:unnamed protein product [Phytophthora fragariaefolia]
MTKKSAETLLGAAPSWLDLLTGSAGLDTSTSTRTSSESATTKHPSRMGQTKRPSKKRRTTHDIRKQQKNDLLAEVAELEMQLELIKHRILLESGEAMTTIKRTEATNSVLQELALQQHASIAGLQGMLASQMQKSLSLSNPTHIAIQLVAGHAERRATLVAMKKRKLHEAKRFITAWCQQLHTIASFSQENVIESLDGGFSVVRFDNTPLPGTSVRGAFNAIIYAMQNVDIIISELFGSITIREDTDFSASDIFQIRLASSTSHGATVESNSVVFSELVDGPDECYGIVAADFVDADDLYPYLPTERVRRDTVTIVLIRSSPADVDSQAAVVATRWTLSKLMPQPFRTSNGGTPTNFDDVGRHDQEVYRAASSEGYQRMTQ